LKLKKGSSVCSLDAIFNYKPLLERATEEELYRILACLALMKKNAELKNFVEFDVIIQKVEKKGWNKIVLDRTVEYWKKKGRKEIIAFLDYMSRGCCNAGVDNFISHFCKHYEQEIKKTQKKKGKKKGEYELL